MGLHARPAALFVQTAARGAGMEVTVGKAGKDPVNAKSILAVLGLDARHGEQVVVAGPRARAPTRCWTTWRPCSRSRERGA